MRFINWLNSPVYIQHATTGDRINVTPENVATVLRSANKYHASWSTVSRLKSWFKG